MILIDAERLTASRPNRPLFADVSLTVSDGDRIGVVGINGSGKSTLLRMLAGELDPDAAADGGPGVGTVRRGRGARIGFLPQRPELPAGTVRDAVGGGWQGEAMLDRLGMAALAATPTGELSGGQAKRTALARLLCGEYEALILDEPTNHLDLDAIRFLEDWLAAFRGGLLLVTHDRHVLDRVTTRVLEIDRGTAYLHVPQGRHAGSGYAAYLAGRAERAERAEAAEQVRRNLATRELAWLRRGAPARSTKPKARLATATALVNGRAQAEARAGELGLASSLGGGAQRLGSKGIEVERVSFAWPDNPHDNPHDGQPDGQPDGQRVLDPLSLVLEPGDRIGIVGPNGAGKSTLLDLVAGRLTPSSGSIDRGATVAIGYYDQLGRQMDGDQRVREAVAGDKVEPSLDDVTLMRRFWFDGDSQFAPIRTLSGGERRRLQLLLTLLERPNVLLLDEPTNDLDLDTLRALEDFLDGWPGIVVTVSHDRAFLDRVTDELLALDGHGGARWVRGGVAAWLAEREAASGTPTPSRPRRQGSPPGRSQVAEGPAPGRGSSTASGSTAGKPISPSTIRRRIVQTERDLERATAERDRCTASFAGAADHAALTDLGRRLAEAQAKVDELEHLWLSLAQAAHEAGID